MNNVVVSPAQAHPTYTAATRSRFSAMRSGALFALVAWQFLLVEPLHEVQPYDVDADALEMLIPLLMSEQNDRSDRTQDSDEAFSSIPAYAFTLDETLPPVPFASPAQSVPLVSPTQSASRGSRKRDLSRDQEVNRVARPRALLLGDNNSDDDDEGQELWRACERLASSRAGGALEVLMYLCAELLDAAGPRGLSPCPCCGASNGPRVSYVTLKDSNPLHISSVVGRREHRPLGDNEDVVQRYAQVLRKKRMRLGR